MSDNRGFRDRSPLVGLGDRRSRIPSRNVVHQRAEPDRRIFISNIPFEMKWQEVKDMFRNEVGEVSYVEMFKDKDDKPRGCGILEFESPAMVDLAIEKMHRRDLRGRKLVVKKDFESKRDQYGRLILDGHGERPAKKEYRPRSDGISNRLGTGSSQRSDGGEGFNESGLEQTFGLSTQFLHSLGIDGPLQTRLFVANLSYEINERRLRDCFRMAGRVVSVELKRDKEGKSRGYGIIEMEHPVEAVQAISMFNNQMYFDRKMNVRFDYQASDDRHQLPDRIPEGLAAVGMGLGHGGAPLTNISEKFSTSKFNNIENVGSSMGNVQPMELQSLIPSQSSMTPIVDPMSVANAMTLLASLGRGTGFGASRGVGGSSMSSGIINSFVGGGGDRRNMDGPNHELQERTSDTILVRNLPLDCTWQGLKDGFRNCGDIKYAEIKERGTGLIRFASEREADRAISMMHNQIISDRPIEVRLY